MLAVHSKPLCRLMPHYRGLLNMKVLLLVFMTLGLTVYGQLIIKARALVHNGMGGREFLLAMFLDPWVLSGLAAAVMASAAWMLAVRDAYVSVIYPMMALSFVLVPLLASFLFGEPLRGSQVLGWGLIVAGLSLSGLVHW
jgi:drug/metabolite transporter (DMT)-like permease